MLLISLFRKNIRLPNDLEKRRIPVRNQWRGSYINKQKHPQTLSLSHVHLSSVCDLRISGFREKKAMASTAASTPLSLSSSSTLLDTKGSRQPSNASSQCVTLPTLAPSLQPQCHAAKTTVHCRKIARNVVAMATGEAPAEVATTELPDIVKRIQEAWDKVEDKYAVSSLVVAGVVALWGSTGLVSAIDRLPLIPGALELVGIGYTGWFAYNNLFFKPDREALIKKIKEIYEEIIGTSS